MILYTENNEKVSCIKCKSPYFNGPYKYLWDHIEASIDNKILPFYKSVKNNGGYYYFQKDGQWYKSDIIQKNSLDLEEYLQRKCGVLLTERIGDL